MRPGATSFPQAIGLAATFDTSLMSRVATAIAEETRSRGIRQVLSPVINIANDVALGSRRRNLRRRSGALVADGACVRGRVRDARRRRDAEALHRQRRRRRARQLSDRLRRAAARGDVLSAVRGGDSRGACAIGDERVQLGRRVAGDAEPLAAHRQAAPRLGLSRLRDLRRRGDRRRDGAASHRGDHRDRDEGRARRRARRDLSIVVAAASAVSRRVSVAG